MNVDQANKIILKPYITEKTFAMIENERKICFIVEKQASKPEIRITSYNVCYTKLLRAFLSWLQGLLLFPQFQTEQRLFYRKLSWLY